jgi:hypothetical protein
MYALVSGEQGTPLLTPARKELAGQQVTERPLNVEGP